MRWLDFKLFGNGFGLKSPYFDDVFYWLDGRFYNWIGGFGAQLQSIEWRLPKPGTRRTLAGREFVVFHGTRGRWPLKWKISWAMTGLGKSTDEDLARIREFKDVLRNL